MNKFSRIAVPIALFLIGVFGTLLILTSYYDNQFRVIYNLDRKQNDQEVIKLINQADKYVYFAVFTFTKDDIADALVKAKQRGVIVWGITDKEQSLRPYEQPIVQKLLGAGISVETQKHFDGIMHIKLVVTDKAYGVGSYNWTESATMANDEVLEIGTNGYLHDRYLAIVQKVLVANQ
jgi:phosphatidylserine/phosphatidylglycerophosphate/cardiolipin synthase-like enzyme